MLLFNAFYEYFMPLFSAFYEDFMLYLRHFMNISCYYCILYVPILSNAIEHIAPWESY